MLTIPINMVWLAKKSNMQFYQIGNYLFLYGY